MARKRRLDRPCGFVDHFCGPGAFSASGGGSFTSTGPYSLFAAVNVIFSGPGIVNFNDIQRVPAPTTAVLIITGAVLLGGWVRVAWRGVLRAPVLRLVASA